MTIEIIDVDALIKRNCEAIKHCQNHGIELPAEAYEYDIILARLKAAEKSLSHYREMTYGQHAYEAYCAATGWKSLVSGCDLPQWDSLAPEIQDAWDKAGHAVGRCMIDRLNWIREE